MLRMAPFEVVHASSSEEAVQLLSETDGEARLCAGGTDLVPNIKHGLHEPVRVVHLSGAKDLRGITANADGSLRLGAMCTLAEIERDADVQRLAPGLADAAHHVAGPQLREMGTLGGNLCLDTRCLYYNQTYFWRESLGFCLKKDGEICHVVAGGKKCVAAASNDTATMLLSLDAVVEIRNGDGIRDVPLREFYVANGVANTILEPNEILVGVKVPASPSKRLEGFAKLRHRESIDFPLLSVGVALHIGDDKTVESAALTVNALGAKPRDVKTDALVGKALDDESALEALCAFAHKKCSPLTNIADDPAWRKDMVPVFVRQAVEQARARA